jgi:formate-dependent nitrite reductase membrane component NrfD
MVGSTLIALPSSAETSESTSRILASRALVYADFVLVLAAPLVLMIYLTAGRGATALGSLIAVSVLGAALGLIGGLILRWAVLSAGAMPTWRVAGMEFRRIPRPKDPKPSMGMLPPS